jgi:hypothetical protein
MMFIAFSALKSRFSWIAPFLNSGFTILSRTKFQTMHPDSRFFHRHINAADSARPFGRIRSSSCLWLQFLRGLRRLSPLVQLLITNYGNLPQPRGT